MSDSATELHPLTFSVPKPVAQNILSIGRTKLYELLGLGQLDGVRHGLRTEITVESIRRYQKSLPRATFKPPSPPRLESLEKLRQKHAEQRRAKRAARRRSKGE